MSYINIWSDMITGKEGLRARSAFKKRKNNKKRRRRNRETKKKSHKRTKLIPVAARTHYLRQTMIKLNIIYLNWVMINNYI